MKRYVHIAIFDANPEKFEKCVKCILINKIMIKTLLPTKKMIMSLEINGKKIAIEGALTEFNVAFKIFKIPRSVYQRRT